MKARVSTDKKFVHYEWATRPAAEGRASLHSSHSSHRTWPGCASTRHKQHHCQSNRSQHRLQLLRPFPTTDLNSLIPSGRPFAIFTSSRQFAQGASTVKVESACFQQLQVRNYLYPLPLRYLYPSLEVTRRECDAPCQSVPSVKEARSPQLPTYPSH